MQSLLSKSFFGLALLCLISFSIVSVGAEAVGRISQPILKPFEAYLDIFPDQPLSAVVVRGFSCRVSHYHYAQPVQTLCVLTPTASIFSRIEVEDINQRVSWIKFAPRGDAFRFGDLLVMLDLPQHHFYPQFAIALWRDYFVKVELNKGFWVSPVQQRVWSITFTRAVGPVALT